VDAASAAAGAARRAAARPARIALRRWLIGAGSTSFQRGN
jgi:hypothetical protein